MIFYFTGTGNSLMAAKYLAEENERLVDMAKARKAGELLFELEEGERLGFVFPTYFYTMGDVVFDFLQKVKILGAQKAFGVVTCAGGIGGTGAFLKKELAKKGIALTYLTPLLMPENAIYYFSLADDEKNAQCLTKAEARLDQIKEDLRAGKQKPARGLSSKWLRPIYHLGCKTKDYRVTETCIGCGLCAENCPDDAIELRDGRPVWVKATCTKCAACINRCPTHAIQYGKTQNRRRYVNPILK